MLEKLKRKLTDLERLTHEQELIFRDSEPTDMFSDYVDNHILPVVWIKQDGTVLYSNGSMDDLIGCRVCGKNASVYYDNYDDYVSVVQTLQKHSEIKGLPVVLKQRNGKTLRRKLYTSVHRDNEGTWLNTRCIFVPY